jgi:predicted nucleic acid-binding protein
VVALTTALARHRAVGLDTSIFIYHFESATRFAPAAGQAFRDLGDGVFEGVASTVTLMELAVRPLQIGRPDVADEYEVLLANYPHLAIRDVDRRAARRAADLRASTGLRPADALQLGVCLEHGATAFLTNDRRLRPVSDLEVLLLEDFVA